MSHSSDSKDSHDEAIPLLTEVLVTGSPTRSHHVPAPAAPVDTFDDVPVLEDVFEAPTPKDTAPADTHAPEAVAAAPADAAPVVPAADPVTPAEAVAAPLPASTSTPNTTVPNADALADHLRGKFTAYLRGPGQEVIEERCRAAMQVHATWLVGQIAKEVGAVLEAQMSNWVREAVEEERRRQSGA
ncbi:DUF2486 family protein [Paraburkholderia gardini]|uniref:DUF2486 family protein n=1 Tax=Paraburkholderia gardini TaxID=2823469 RepID=A0ABN7QHZ5_9BURK|nr:DUF2486 family protein [Paraburkholderia gardini]CAG4886097.1 hypothetical protein R54767_00143 [Paraburkholderia gardini]CAG4896228.1 hypothetical protein R69919_02159 [Paraburkholderia gardini]